MWWKQNFFTLIPCPFDDCKRGQYLNRMNASIWLCVAVSIKTEVDGFNLFFCIQQIIIKILDCCHQIWKFDRIPLDMIKSMRIHLNMILWYSHLVRYVLQPQFFFSLSLSPYLSLSQLPTSGPLYCVNLILI